MTNRSRKQEKQIFNIEELAKNIAQDIAKLSEDLSKAKITRDLKSLDISSAIPEARTTALNRIFDQIKGDGEKVSQQHQEQIQMQSEALEESIKSRQENLRLNLSKLQEAEEKVSGSSKIVEMKVNENIRSYDRHIEELHLRKIKSRESIWIEADISEELNKAMIEEVPETLTERKVTEKNNPTELNR